jgi:GNAT superfamily N-acetyltransferase
MSAFAARALSPDTWSDFARLVERHDGVWGGCWCLGFHSEGAQRGDHRRDAKKRRVLDGTAHAALVYDGESCVGWCQFGPVDELPRIKRRRAYESLELRAPDWRITCFFVDREYRGQGVATAALRGALKEIARLGGGLVQSFPEDVTDRRTSAGFLHNATTSVFEREGFKREQPLGKRHWLMTKKVPASGDTRRRG